MRGAPAPRTAGRRGRRGALPSTPVTATTRLGVLDIGSNTVHLAVVDAAPGARPVQAAGARTVVRIMRYLQPDGSLSPEGVAAMLTAVDDAMALARESGVKALPFSSHTGEGRDALWKAIAALGAVSPT